MTNGFYDVQLAKGQGMIPETILLLNSWRPGLSPPVLRNEVIAGGLLPKATAYRASDIVTRVFAPRYLGGGDTPAKWLKRTDRGRSLIMATPGRISYGDRASDSDSPGCPPPGVVQSNPPSSSSSPAAVPPTPTLPDPLGPRPERSPWEILLPLKPCYRDTRLWRIRGPESPVARSQAALCRLDYSASLEGRSLTSSG
jgi:hypothetical protein